MAKLLFQARKTGLMTAMCPRLASCYIEIEMSIVCVRLATYAEAAPVLNRNSALYLDPVV